jgi:hypothetical protein
LRDTGVAARAAAEIDIERILTTRHIGEDEPEAEAREDGHDRDP